MTVSDQKTETWRPVPGAGYYEASDLGKIRSVDRTIDGRFYKGVVLKLHEDPDGYLRVNITNDKREREHNVSVARLVLMAFDPDGYAPGLEACHQPGTRRSDCRLVSLRWDTKDANREEALALRLVNNPPKPKPPKVCPRCNQEHRGKGRNCHDCVVGLGVTTAAFLVEGKPLDWIADELDYPPAGLVNLAVRHGRLRFVIGDPQAELAAAEAAAGYTVRPEPWLDHPAQWLRRVIFRREASRQNSDAQ